MKNINPKYPEIGICGLSCRFCPHYQSNSKSKCNGCKSSERIAVGCPFITCAIKKKNIEFCFECNESLTCELWKKHRENSKKYDSFVCYQELESNISFINKNGIEAFEKNQIKKEKILRKILNEFDEGRSKSYYCIAVTILDIDELNNALNQAKDKELDKKKKAKLLHSLLDDLAIKKGKNIKLRKKV